MQLPTSRGPLSAAVVDVLSAPYDDTVRLDQPVADSAAPLLDADLQLALASCYELHFQGFDGVDDRWEWHSGLLAFRGRLERVQERALRELVGPTAAPDEPVHRTLARMVAADDGPSLSAYVLRRATLDQVRELLAQRSVYHLREADPHTFAVPRLHGAAKAAMVEIQADEYGGGDPARMHSALFARTLAEVGLDPAYGAHWPAASATTFASVNTMSLFGLHRRLRAAAVGHLAIVEMTSTGASRRYANALRRLGFGPAATRFYDEHVEADAVHEQVAAVDMCGGLVAAEPGLRADLLFGAACALAVDALGTGELLGRWKVAVGA